MKQQLKVKKFSRVWNKEKKVIEERAQKKNFLKMNREYEETI